MSLAAVQKAIESKRISVVVDERGKRRIDPAVADIQWAQNTRPDQQERGALQQFEKTQADLAKIGTAGLLPPSAGDDVPTSQLSAEKAETETVRRQLLELQLQQKRGELVRVDDIERAMANKLKAANDSFNTLADRLAPILAAETDVDKVDAILRKEIRHCMNQIAQEAPYSTH